MPSCARCTLRLTGVTDVLGPDAVDPANEMHPAQWPIGTTDGVTCADPYTDDADGDGFTATGDVDGVPGTVIDPDDNDAANIPVGAHAVTPTSAYATLVIWNVGADVLSAREGTGAPGDPYTTGRTTSAHTDIVVLNSAHSSTSDPASGLSILTTIVWNSAVPALRSALTLIGVSNAGQ